MKFSPVKKRIVVDQSVILFQDLCFRHGRKRGKFLIFDLLYIQRTKMKDQYMLSERQKRKPEMPVTRSAKKDDFIG